MDDDPLPPPGPPFAAGDEVAFFPAEIDIPGDLGWLGWDYAVIDEVDAPAQSFDFHFVSTPDVRHAQGFENVVRRSARYEEWRAAFKQVLDAGKDPYADPGVTELMARVLAEHPIYGGSEYPHALVADRRSSDIRRR